VAAKRGWLRIFILYLEEKPAAFWMGTIYDHCLQADQVGYDPVWGEFSPGIFLFLTILEDLPMRTSRPLILAGATPRSGGVSATCDALKHASTFMRLRCVESS
jgi:hypothetical protein